MNLKDYTLFRARVCTFLCSNNVRPGCHGCTNPDQEDFFSKSPCECCGQALHGNREGWTFAYNQKQEDGSAEFTADICSDCVHFLTYGALDDAQMLEVEKEIAEQNTREAVFMRFTFSMPLDAALQCSHQGECIEDVRAWASKIVRPDSITPELLKAELRECGAWTPEDLEDDAQNWERLIWIAAGNIKDDERERLNHTCESEPPF